MNDRTLAWASGILLLAVALGAFGVHTIRPLVGIESYQSWATAVQYQFYHGLALLGLAAIHDRLRVRSVTLVRILFVLGVICFCGSLYLLSLREVLGIQKLTHVLGPITPLGGLLFIAGWAVLFVQAVRKA